MKNKYRYKKWWVIGTLIVCVIIAIPIFINWAYTKGTANGEPNTAFSAGDLLTFYGACLASLCTVALGFLALWQNKKSNEINQKLLDADLIKNFYSYLTPHSFFIIPSEAIKSCSNKLFTGTGNIEKNVGYATFQLKFLSSNNHSIKSARITKFSIKDGSPKVFLGIAKLLKISFVAKSDFTQLITTSACVGNDQKTNVVGIIFSCQLNRLLNEEPHELVEYQVNFNDYDFIQFEIDISFVNTFNVETTAKYMFSCKRETTHDDTVIKYVPTEQDNRVFNSVVKSIKVVKN